ncbi:MAG: Serine/threonine-protein kinase PknD [Myxococcota bacterium]|nr:Serine/threonine-protein kinase PknD [Myxococcota bacterium]
MKICPSCFAGNEDNARFCIKCGAVIEGVAPSTNSPPRGFSGMGAGGAGALPAARPEPPVKVVVVQPGSGENQISTPVPAIQMMELEHPRPHAPSPMNVEADGFVLESVPPSAPPPANMPVPSVSDMPALGKDPGAISRPTVDRYLNRVIDKRYRVLQCVGIGGMGAVFKVEHTKMQKIMAMKVLRTDYTGTQDLRTRFQHEARAASRLTHINTVSVFDFGETAEGDLFLVMEYLNGITMAQLLEKQRIMDEVRAARIAIQVCRSLAEAHDHGIVHRDIKPENIFLVSNREGRDFVKVLDFGVAKLNWMNESASVSIIGTVMGTPYYMAPEQAKGKVIDGRADQYSLGATLFEMVTGAPPFKGATAMEVLIAHNTSRLPYFREVNPNLHVSPEFESIIRRSLSKKPDERFPTVLQMATALEEYLQKTSAASAPPVIQAVPRPNTREFDEMDARVAGRADWESFERRLKWSAWLRNGFISLALLGGMAAAGYWYFQNQSQTLTTSEIEPNDDPGGVRKYGPITFGPQGVTGVIGTAGDKDLFLVRVPPGESKLRVVLHGPADINLALALYKSDGANTQLIVSQQEQEAGQAEIIPNLHVSAGDYLVTVKESVLAGNKPLATSQEPYKLTAELSPLTPKDEVEPENNTLLTAQKNTLSVNSFFNGYLTDQKDEDWFAVTINDPDKGLRIEVTPPGGMDVGLRVHTAARTLYYVSGQMTTDGLWDHEKGSRPESIVLDPQKVGSPFYVQVTPIQTKPDTETYVIRSEVTDLPPRKPEDAPEK